jgi:hypothetical protein
MIFPQQTGRHQRPLDPQPSAPHREHGASQQYARHGYPMAAADHLIGVKQMDAGATHAMVQSEPLARAFRMLSVTERGRAQSGRRLVSSVRILYSVRQLRCRLLRTTAVPTLSLGAEDARIEVAKDLLGAGIGAVRLAAGRDRGRPLPGQTAWPDPVGGTAGGSRNETIKEDHRSAGNHLSGRRGVSAGQDGGRCEIRTRDGLAPNTLFQQG